jgi:hypothetical protein
LPSRSAYAHRRTRAHPQASEGDRALAWRPAGGPVEPEGLGEASATVGLDIAGLAERIVPFPVAAVRYDKLRVVTDGVVWLEPPRAGELGETVIGGWADPAALGRTGGNNIPKAALLSDPAATYHDLGCCSAFALSQSRGTTSTHTIIPALCAKAGVPATDVPSQSGQRESRRGLRAMGTKGSNAGLGMIQKSP